MQSCQFTNFMYQNMTKYTISYHYYNIIMDEDMQSNYDQQGTSISTNCCQYKGGEQVAKLGGLRPLTVYCDNR